MRAKIKNKNSNQWFQVEEGGVISLRKDETLDKATISLINVGSEIDIEPYDRVILNDEGGRLPDMEMCVESYSEIQTGLNPVFFKYEIQLMSATKELEGVILPNLKITRMPSQQRSIWYYMQQYLDEYCPKIRVGSSADEFLFEDKYTLDSNFRSIFADVCPEMQWNEPTLREVLNDLAMVKDHIVRVVGNTISFLDLTATQIPNQTALNAINYQRRSQSSEDYVSAIRMNMQNVTNPAGGNQAHTTVAEVVHFTSNDSLMTSNNFVLKTKYPIYAIKKLTMFFQVSALFGQGNDEFQNASWYSADLMSCTLGENNGTGKVNNQRLVYESKEWEILKTKFKDFDVTPVSQFKDFKNYTAYFTRGSNVIDGFRQTTKTVLMTYSWFQYIMAAILGGKYPFYKDGQLVQLVNRVYGDYHTTFFAIEYETLQGLVCEVSKGDYPNHPRVIVDGQTNSYIDSQAQGLLEYMKANRLGNKQKLINATYRNGEAYSDMLKIGDSYDGRIIYSAEYSIYKFHVEFNGYATENWVLRNYYTGIKAKRRSWLIAQGEGVLTRHDLKKTHLQFDWSEKKDRLYDGGVELYDLPTYFLSPLNGYVTPKPLLSVFVKAKISESPVEYEPYSEDPYTDYRYVLDLSSRVVGNSVCFTFAFDDNYWAGKYIDRDETNIHYDGEHHGALLRYDDITGGTPMNNYRYTNLRGESLSLLCSFSSSKTLIDQPLEGDSMNAGMESTLADILALPLLDAGAIGGVEMRTNFDHVKDSQEITACTYQVEMCSADHTICFTSEFMRRQKCISKDPVQYYMTMVVADISTYDFRNPQVPTEGITSYNCLAGVIPNGDENSSRCIITTDAFDELNPDDFRGKAIYILRGDDLLLAMTPPGYAISPVEVEVDGTTYIEVRVTLYLNRLVILDKNIYDNKTDQNKVAVF